MPVALCVLLYNVQGSYSKGLCSWDTRAQVALLFCLFVCLFVFDECGLEKDVLLHGCHNFYAERDCCSSVHRGFQSVLCTTIVLNKIQSCVSWTELFVWLIPLGCCPKTTVLVQSGLLIAEDGDITCLYSMWEDTGLIYKREETKQTKRTFI